MLKAFRKQKYYHENFGTYKILKIWVRTDYNKKDALILTDDGFWHKVPYEWLICDSIVI